MKHYGLTLNLKNDPEIIEKYKEYHRNPWIEPLQGARDIGVTAMKIFLLGRRMFMFLTTVDDFDPQRDFSRYMEQSPKAREWDELMCTFQEKVPEAGEDEWWAVMEEVFDMETHLPNEP